MRYLLVADEAIPEFALPQGALLGVDIGADPAIVASWPGPEGELVVRVLPPNYGMCLILLERESVRWINPPPVAVASPSQPRPAHAPCRLAQRLHLLKRAAGQ